MDGKGQGQPLIQPQDIRILEAVDASALTTPLITLSSLTVICWLGRKAKFSKILANPLAKQEVLAERR